MQEFSQTRNGQIFLADVHRIAAALEQLAKAMTRIADTTPPATPKA